MADLEIFENRDEWYATYQAGWLAHFNETGVMDWKIYKRPTNQTGIPGNSIDLSQSRLMLISSAGSYLPDSQESFDADSADAHPFGDYSMRIIPSTVALDELAIAHGNYNHAAINEDQQVLIPLRHLDNMVAEGKIGALTSNYISFMGYQPDATRAVDELIPKIVETAKAEQAQAALLVPS